MANYTENFTSVNGDVTDASELETEFDAIATAIATKLDSDGSGTMTGNLDMGSNQIDNVTDPTAAQDAATKNYVDNSRQAAYSLSVTAANIATVEAVEDTLSVTIPSDWNTYDLELIATGYINETGTLTGNRVVTIRFRETALVSGTVISTTQVRVGTDSADRPGFALFGALTGETTTGSVTCNISMVISDDTNQVQHTQLEWKLSAHRTS